MNLFRRSGFVNTAYPYWAFWDGATRGDCVASDHAPEIGMAVKNGPDLTPANHYIQMECPIGALIEDQPYFLSFIVKPLTKDFIFIRENANAIAGGISKRTYFDVANLAFGTSHPDHTNTIIQDLGDGVVRVGLSFTPEDLDNQLQNTITVGVAEVDNLNTFIGVPDEEVAALFHAQIEFGRYPGAPEVKFPGM